MSGQPEELFSIFIEYEPSDGGERLKLPPELSVATGEWGAAAAASI
jgi:hypothetical protein